MNTDLIAALLAEREEVKLSLEDAIRILQRNARFLSEPSREDYYSIVLLEVSEFLPKELDTVQFEHLCNRVSKRLLYASKTRSERFIELAKLGTEPSVSPENHLYVKEVLQQLALQEQIYLTMRMEGYTINEIAERFHLPVSTVHHAWMKISSKVKKLITESNA